MLIQTSSPDIDTLKSLLRAEMLRYQIAIGNDSPFREARKIRKNINKLKMLLAQQQQSCVH